MMEPLRGTKAHVEALFDEVRDPGRTGRPAAGVSERSELRTCPSESSKQKPAPKERVEETAEVAAPAKQGEELKEELDDLLDEIDTVLEDERRGVRKKLRPKRRRMTVTSTGDVTVTPLSYDSGMKRCKKCGEIKPLDEFYRAAGMQ